MNIPQAEHCYPHKGITRGGNHRCKDGVAADTIAKSSIHQTGTSPESPRVHFFEKFVCRDQVMSVERSGRKNEIGARGATFALSLGAVGDELNATTTARN